MNNSTDARPGEAAKPLLFGQVRYHLVLSEKLGDADASKLSQVLSDNGAREKARCTSDDKIKTLDDVTHVISTTSDFPDYDRVKEALIPVVKPDWILASVTKGRLANPRQYSPDPRLFFSGLVVCCADLPAGDADAIIGGVLAMGGLYSSSVSKMITHIVALTEESEKCQVALTKNVKCKIVLPHWFDDCLKLGKRIDEGPYCLPDPEIMRKKAEDRIPEAARKDMETSSSARPDRLPTPMSSPSAERRQLGVFKNKRVMLSPDLGLGSHLRGTVEGLVESGGGSTTTSVHKADIFICQYRESVDYRIASRAGRDVGNLAWLYHLLTTNKWTSPMNRLLHYPVARDGLPGFKDFKISLSNYNGEARVYLENLAKAAGGEFTKTMKEDNTHLITAHLASEKCDAAKEWNIAMVNHLWLEESYAKWQIQALTNTRYSHFPPRTNLGEIIGQTRIDKQAAEKSFFPEGCDADQALKPDARLKPSKVKDLPLPPPKVPTSSAVQPHSSAHAPEPMPFRDLSSDGPTPKAPRGRPVGSTNAMRTPATPRYSNAGKENDTPSTTGSRGAKDKAAAKLHDMAPDIALFQKEMKRVGGVMHGGRRTSEDEVADGSRKRSISKDDDSGTEVEEEGRVVKKAKRAKLGPAPIRLCITGDQRWVGQSKKEGEERARLRDMGIMVLAEPAANITHLAAPRIVRTKKFVCAVAHGPTVINLDYIDQCLSKNERLDPKDFLLKETPEDFAKGYKLAESIERAKMSKGRLLRNYTIYCTENVRGGIDTYKAIIEENGGACLLYRARATSTANQSRPDGPDEDGEDQTPSTPEYLYLVSSQEDDDTKLWSRFRQMALDKGRSPRIVHTDWVLDLALRQEIRWDPKYDIA